MFVKQSIDRPVGVNVYGSEVVRTEPDRAEVDLAVIRLARTPAAAFEQTGRAVHAVRAVLRTGGIADADLEVSRVSLETAYDRLGGSAKFIGYRSQVSFRFLVRQLDTIEKLLTAAVDAGANEVQRVRYQSTHLRELRTEARRRAVEAARRKAEVYCDAAGVRVGQVIHIEDMNPEVGLYRASGAHGMAPVSEDEGSETPGDLQPGSLVISAGVMVTFGILHG